MMVESECTVRRRRGGKGELEECMRATLNPASLFTPTAFTAVNAVVELLQQLTTACAALHSLTRSLIEFFFRLVGAVLWFPSPSLHAQTRHVIHSRPPIDLQKQQEN